MFIRSALLSSNSFKVYSLTSLPRTSVSITSIHRIPIHTLRKSPSVRMSSTLVKPAGMLSNRYKIEEMPDLTGKVALVTGGSRGIGQAAVTALVQKGCQVHLVGATQEHLDEAIQTITSSHPSTSNLLHPHQLNMESLKDVIKFGEKLNHELSRLDMLYLIAGVGVAPYRLSKDGLSVHWSVNHLAHLVLFDTLLPKLKETSASKNKTGDDNSDEEKFSTRIITESSELHRTAGDVRLENLDEVNKEMDANRMYARSKLYGLPTLTSSTPIIATSVHPGAVGTEQQKGATEAYGLLGKVVEAAGKTLFMTQEQGSESALWAGTSPKVVRRREEVHGGYFTEADGKAGTESDQAKDSELIRRLWDLSVEQLKNTVNYELKL